MPRAVALLLLGVTVGACAHVPRQPMFARSRYVCLGLKAKPPEPKGGPALPARDGSTEYDATEYDAIECHVLDRERGLYVRILVVPVPKQRPGPRPENRAGRASP